MFFIRGTLRNAAQTAGGVNRQTGEMRKPSSYLQVEINSGGRLDILTLYVPDHRPYIDKIGQVVNLPVRPWAKGATVNFAFDADALSSLQEKDAKAPVARVA